MKTGTYLHSHHNELLWLCQPPCIYERASLGTVSLSSSSESVSYVAEPTRVFGLMFTERTKTEHSSYVLSPAPIYELCFLDFEFIFPANLLTRSGTNPVHHWESTELLPCSHMNPSKSWTWDLGHDDLICLYSFFSVTVWNLATVARAIILHQGEVKINESIFF